MNNFNESLSLCAFLLGLSYLLVHWKYQFETLSVCSEGFQPVWAAPPRNIVQSQPPRRRTSPRTAATRFRILPPKRRTQ